VPVAHVEAGLRSFMMIMPEEQNRRLTDHISTWLFCPTETAVNNLKREGIINSANALNYDFDNKCVTISGDIMYEASLYYRNLNNFHTKEKDFILLTIHRAENTDNPMRLGAIVNGINRLSDYKFIFPIHPRTQKILIQNNLNFMDHVRVIEPVSYFQMLAYESACFAVLTDSGGVQKEAFFFKKPCITLRDTTEWIELVDAGWNILVGAEPEKIVTAVKNIRIPKTYHYLYGDGNCAEKIINCLLRKL
jgi:UDP-GlcNAc3NAcA epimerase